MRKLFVSIGIATLLVGCATPEQKAERMIKRYGPMCEKLGYTKNTDQWRDCIMKERKRVSDFVSNRRRN
jgi:hypothetical protein